MHVAYFANADEDVDPPEGAVVVVLVAGDEPFVLAPHAASARTEAPRSNDQMRRRLRGTNPTQPRQPKVVL
jgi:hypothetical protein